MTSSTDASSAAKATDTLHRLEAQGMAEMASKALTEFDQGKRYSKSEVLKPLTYYLEACADHDHMDGPRWAHAEITPELLQEIMQARALCKLLNLKSVTLNHTSLQWMPRWIAENDQIKTTGLKVTQDDLMWEAISENVTYKLNTFPLRFEAADSDPSLADALASGDQKHYCSSMDEESAADEVEDHIIAAREDDFMRAEEATSTRNAQSIGKAGDNLPGVG